MPLFQILDIHIIALATLLVVFFGLPASIRRHNHLFVAIVLVCAGALGLEFATWVLDGSTWAFSRFLLYFLNTGLLFLTALVPFLIFQYINFYIFPVIGRHSPALPFISAVPLCLSILLLGANLFSSVIFYIDYLNNYQRGLWFPAIGACGYFYLLLTLGKLWLGCRRLSRKEFSIILLVPVAPAIGGWLQGQAYGLVSYWGGMTIAIVIIFFYLLRGELQTDYLTGAYNRRQLDNRIDDLLRELSRGESFAALFVDINGFKAINDRFGHGVGDQVLIDTVAVLRQGIRANDFVSRYGGDEFVLLLPQSGVGELDSVIQRIGHRVADYNREKPKGRQLALSIGRAAFSPDKPLTRAEMLRQIDGLMYDVKQGRVGTIKAEPERKA